MSRQSFPKGRIFCRDRGFSVATELAKQGSFSIATKNPVAHYKARRAQAMRT